MVSLIICTLGRMTELERLLISIENQTSRDFEVLLIDQNPSDLLQDLVERFKQSFKIKHLKSEKGLSLGRNVGLRSSSGDIIGFPDDDCVFTDSYFLEKINREFSSAQHLDGVCVQSFGIEDQKPLMRFPIRKSQITTKNVWHSASSITMYFRKKSIAAIFFDEQLGLGARSIFQSGEETDFILKVLRNNGFVQYIPELRIEHPAFIKSYDKNAIRRAYTYGLGQGRTLKINNCPFTIALPLFLRPLIGAALALIKMNLKAAEYYLNSLKGRTRGYFSRNT